LTAFVSSFRKNGITRTSLSTGVETVMFAETLYGSNVTVGNIDGGLVFNAVNSAFTYHITCSSFSASSGTGQVTNPAP
jgi:hypothetical protein